MALDLGAAYAVWQANYGNLRCKNHDSHFLWGFVDSRFNRFINLFAHRIIKEDTQMLGCCMRMGKRR